MTEMEIITIANEYALKGIRSTDEIECELIISDSYNLYGGAAYNEGKLKDVIEPLYHGQSKLITSGEILDAVGCHNNELISEWAFTRVTETYSEEDFMAMTKEQLYEIVEDQECSFIDYLSYNGHLDDTYEVTRYLREQKMSCVCSLDDDCVYEIIFPKDGDDEVTLNYCQTIMFNSIYEYQERDREITVFNMGSKYIHIADY